MAHDARVEFELMDFHSIKEHAMDWLSQFACSGCALATHAIDSMFRNGVFTWIIEHTLSFGCIVSGVVGDRFKVCPLIIKQFYEPAIPVITDYVITRSRICTERLHLCREPVIKEIDLTEVVDGILSTKPESIKDDDYINKMYAEIAADTGERETFLAVHLSDVHIDNDYLEGSLANCVEYLCCREYSGMPKRKGDIPAAKWGSALCDLPVPTFQTMLDYVVSDVKPDMLFWTGDNSPHNIWYNT